MLYSSLDYRRVAMITKPTLLTKDRIAMVISYIDMFLPDYEGENHEAVPTRAGLALYIGVSKRSVEAWTARGREDAEGNDRELYKEFAELIDTMDDRQEVSLVSGALKKHYEPRTANMMLSRFGYVEKKEVDNKSSDGSMTPPDNMYKIVSE